MNHFFCATHPEVYLAALALKINILRQKLFIIFGTRAEANLCILAIKISILRKKSSLFAPFVRR